MVERIRLKGKYILPKSLVFQHTLKHYMTKSPNGPNEGIKQLRYELCKICYNEQKI